MLPSKTLMRSPSTRIIAKVQQEIMAEAPMYYTEDLTEEEEPVDEDEDDGSVQWGKVILHHARLKVCSDLTKEHRIAQGCRNMAKVSRTPQQSQEIAVTLAFASSRAADLQAELKELVYGSQLALRYGRSMDKMAPTETVLKMLLEEQQGAAVAMKDRLRRHCSSTPMDHHLPKNTRDGDYVGCWAIVPAVAMASDVCLKDACERMLVNHYLETPELVSDATQLLETLRSTLFQTNAKAKPTTSPPAARLTKLVKYYHYICNLEDRFFSQGQLRGVYFRWYDWFSGVEQVSGHLVVEKLASILSAAAVASQAAAIEPLDDEASIARARTYFEMAAGLFELGLVMLDEADGLDDELGPSCNPNTLKVMVSLMLAQAQECHWKQHLAQTMERNMEEEVLPSMREAAAVAKLYLDAKEVLSQDGCIAGAILPEEWLGIVFAKSREFDGIAHYLQGLHILNNRMVDDESALQAGTQHLLRSKKLLEQGVAVCRDDPERRLLLLELRCNMGWKEVSQACKRFMIPEPRDGHQGMSVFVEASASRWAQPICLPALSKPQDLFSKLGPAHFFNARCPLHHRRRVRMSRKDVEQSWGFSLEGGRPCRVAELTPDGVAHGAGLVEGTFILAVNKVDVRSKSHRQVVAALKAAKRSLVLTVVDNVHVDLGWIQDIAQQPPSETDASDLEFDAILDAMSLASQSTANEEQQRMQFFDQLAEAATLLEEEPKE
eukprot:m.163561 g.163561  ORF g.163561 m.163561 type:complete len:721 (+) comp16554_c0_seq1:99-2261(+)